MSIDELEFDASLATRAELARLDKLRDDDADWRELVERWSLDTLGVTARIAQVDLNKREIYFEAELRFKMKWKPKDKDEIDKRRSNRDIVAMHFDFDLTWWVYVKDRWHEFADLADLGRVLHGA